MARINHAFDQHQAAIYYVSRSWHKNKYTKLWARVSGISIAHRDASMGTLRQVQKSAMEPNQYALFCYQPTYNEDCICALFRC